MSTGVRVPLGAASRVAEDLLGSLRMGCDRIEIAGSIRRGRPDVGDIELVAIPRMRRERSGLFETVELSILDDLLGSMVLEGRLRDPDERALKITHGDRYRKQIDVGSGLQVDLFIVRPPAQWGVIYLIRTGPAAFSQWIVTEARRRGHHVDGGALHRGEGCQGRFGPACEVVDTPDEPTFFEALGIPYIAPADRDQ